MTGRRRAALAGLALAVVSCQTPGVVKPQAPDMSELLDSYAQPTGTLDAGATAELALVMGALSALVGETQIVDRVLELLREMVGAVERGQGQPSSEPGEAERIRSALRADGYVVATRICPGWAGEGEVDPGNGSAAATATFSERGLDPVAWGSVTACRYRVGETRVELGSASEEEAFRVYWGEAVSLRSLATQGIVLSLAMSAAIDDVRADLLADLRLVDDGIEYLLRTDSGSLVVRVDADGAVSLRARDGSAACSAQFDCDLGRGESDSNAN